MYTPQGQDFVFGSFVQDLLRARARFWIENYKSLKTVSKASGFKSRIRLKRNKMPRSKNLTRDIKEAEVPLFSSRISIQLHLNFIFYRNQKTKQTKKITTKWYLFSRNHATIRFYDSDFVYRKFLIPNYIRFPEPCCVFLKLPSVLCVLHAH